MFYVRGFVTYILCTNPAVAAILTRSSATAEGQRDALC